MKEWVLITGASAGIGREMAHVFAARGFSVFLVARSEAALQELATGLVTKYGVEATSLALDLAQPEAANRVFDAFQNRGQPLSILVNNAGFGDFGLFHESDPARIEGMIQLNVMALTRLTRLFLPGMVERRRGKILNVASTAAFQPGPTMAVYYATKAFVLSFSEAISNELEGTGITVSCLCPGATESNFQAVARMEESRLVKGRRLPGSREVAEFGYKALMAGRVVAIHGWMNAVMAFSVRFTPRFLVRKLVRLIQDRAH